MTSPAPFAAVEGRGPALVFLHGIGGGHEAWRPQIAAFRDAWRTVAWDMPGYGASPPPADGRLTWPGLADSLAALLDSLGIEAAHLVGHSMGGMVAQAFAARHPDRLRSLVLSGTSAAFGRPDGAWQRRFVAERLAPLDAGRSLADLAPEIVAALVGEDPDPQGVQRAVACLAAVPEATYRAAMACLVTFDGRGELARIRVPTLVLAGARDTNAPPKVMAGMADRIPGAEYVELPGAGHLANLERPDAFNRALSGFLRRVAGRDDARADGTPTQAGRQT